MKEANTVSDLTLLQEAILNGMIDVTHLKEQVEMKKRQEIISNHPYAITHGKDGRWSTYLPYKDGRKNVKFKNRADVENAIVEFYKQSEKTYTFEDVYCEWREYHDQTVGDNSISKYDSDRKRFFDGQKFFTMDIADITEDDINVFIVNTVERLKLSKDPTKKLFLYIKDVMEFAKRHKYISDNAIENMSAKEFYRYSYESSRSAKPRTIQKDVASALSEQFRKDHEKHPNYIPVYAVELAALTGMRVGEIAALTWDCIFDDYMLINKSQKYSSKKKEYYIDKTKNGKERIFPLTKDIKELFARVRAIEEEYGYLSEYVFSNEDGQINFRTICSCIKNKCRQIGIESYGIHAYRKTVNSTMSNQGVPSTVRAALLGHSKEVNERYYTFDISSLSEKAQIIENANRMMSNSPTS